MGGLRKVFDPNVRLSDKDVLPILQGWRRLVRIEQHPHCYDGLIQEVSEDAGKLKFSTVSDGEGQKVLTFELAGADFEQSAEPGDDWDDGFMVFPQVGDWFMLRKWKM